MSIACISTMGSHVLTLIFGDATTQLRAVDATVDAFFLDGFSPPKTRNYGRRISARA
jgi:tRNA U34 5-methylaminomethyl-2-thiouridine-forming methyltransferase MnmC